MDGFPQKTYLLKLLLDYFVCVPESAGLLVQARDLLQLPHPALARRHAVPRTLPLNLGTEFCNTHLYDRLRSHLFGLAFEINLSRSESELRPAQIPKTGIKSDLYLINKKYVDLPQKKNIK